MPTNLERTCWRGMQMDHPADWELTMASPPGRDARCIFSDRVYQRLDVRWRGVRRPFDLDPLLDKHRQGRKDVRIRKLADLPDQWKGLLRQTEGASILHAGRFFKASRTLCEATIIWPAGRDERLERDILQSIEAVDPDRKVQPWCAMGLRASVPAEYELKTVTVPVGRVKWEFAGPPGGAGALGIERIAMPEYWLKTTLAQWLVSELPERQKALSQEAAQFAAHEARQLLSSGSAGTLAVLRGRRRMRLDLAWLCRDCGRVYHVWHSRPSRERKLSLPAGLSVWCCGAAGERQ